MADPIILEDGDPWPIARGDTNTLALEWVEPDDAETPIDLSAVEHVLRIQVKRNADDPRVCSVLDVGSYDGTAYVIATNLATMTIHPSLTRDIPRGDYVADAELTRAQAVITVAGTIDLVAGSSVIAGSGVFDFAGVRRGDILIPAGATGPNQVNVSIVAVGGDGGDDDPGVGNLLTDYAGFVSEAAVSFAIHVGKVDTDFKRTARVSDDRSR